MKIWSRKKVSVSFSENLVSKKSLGSENLVSKKVSVLVFESLVMKKKKTKFGLGKKVSVSVSVKFLVSSFSGVKFMFLLSF